MQTLKQKHEDYEGFVNKFKPKKTTDDCYTPQKIYVEVLRWVDENITPLEGLEIVRPFWPGGDYEGYEYPDGSIVIDNPPFSILSKICKFYNDHGIKYFLFAPELTLFSSGVDSDTFIICDSKIKFENGAIVPIGFRTNLLDGDTKIIVAGDLHERLNAAQQQASEAKAKATYKYPMEVVTSGHLKRIAARGICLKIPKAETYFIRKLDNSLQGLFGSGFLISERAAAERAAAERAAAERAAAERAVAAEATEITLSEREQEIVQNLNCSK